MAGERRETRGKNLNLIAARVRRTMPDGEPMQSQDVAEAVNVFELASRSPAPLQCEVRGYAESIRVSI
ncbi:hypothetical protein Ari01nite_85840 [Paractinoplanes rishiriensis]|uniref:Uncharacterized protein n=1 Tax=Paractinoplanes rishiriensis TaxID=1050105 RepID=A0A919K9H6_9ACTN|nr:hypothetical protein Ari01nite_85840 [Actinoplanes rishiriensis]